MCPEHLLNFLIDLGWKTVNELFESNCLLTAFHLGWKPIPSVWTWIFGVVKESENKNTLYGAGNLLCEAIQVNK